MRPSDRAFDFVVDQLSGDFEMYRRSSAQASGEWRENFAKLADRVREAILVIGETRTNDADAGRAYAIDDPTEALGPAIEGIEAGDR